MRPVTRTKHRNSKKVFSSKQACHMKGIIAATCPCIISCDLSLLKVPVLSFKQQLLAQEFILNCMGFTLLPQQANNYTALLKRSTSVWQNVTQN